MDKSFNRDNHLSGITSDSKNLYTTHISDG